VLVPAAFSDHYTRAVYATVTAMHADGRRVDALTLDWELARQGLPLRLEHGGQTIGTLLTRSVGVDEQPIQAARALQARYERAHVPRAPGDQRGLVKLGPGPRGGILAPGSRAHLRLLPPPPGHEPGSPGYGPQPTA
jgi:hypothetical protein